MAYVVCRRFFPLSMIFPSSNSRFSYAFISIAFVFVLIASPASAKKPKKTPAPTLSISASPAAVTEGQSAIYTVRASSPPPSGQVIYFSYAMTGTAALNQDYTLTGQASFSPGQTSTTFTLLATVTGKITGSETATMVLYAGKGYTVPTGKKAPQATVTINNVVTTAEVQTPFALSGIVKADPVRNRVYMIDRSAPRLLAVDTSSGQIAAATPLENIAPATNVDVDPRVADIAVAIDGSRLYLALSRPQQIRVYSLPDLAPVATLPTDLQPSYLIAAANGRLFASYSGDFPDSGYIREIDVSNGNVLQRFAQEQCGGLCGCPNCLFHPGRSLLRTNPNGTRLYIGEVGTIVVGGPGHIFEFDVSGPTATLLHRYPFVQQNMQDFAVDETQRRIYTLNGGPISDASGYERYGIELTDMLTDNYGDVWPLNGYAAAVAFLPNDTAIYGASSDFYDGDIRKLARIDGTELADYIVGTHGKAIIAQALAITPNGSLVYLSDFFTGCACGFEGYNYFAGIIGRGSLTLSNTPSNGGPSNATLTALNFNDSEGNNDGVANASEIISFAPTFTNNGTQLALNVSVDVAVGSGGTLLSATPQAYGNIPEGTSGTLAPLRIQLDSSLPNRSTVTVTFTVTWNTDQTATFPYTFVIQ